MKNIFSRRKILVLCFIVICIKCHAQGDTVQEYGHTQLEAQAEKKEAEPEDDSYEQDLEELSLHPLNLNSATKEELISLQILDANQISSFILYRNLLGPLITIHELQAVPGMDISTIKKLLPFVRVGRDESVYSALRERWKGGDGAFLLRAAQVLEKAKGFQKPTDPNASHYNGSAQKIFFRYSYNYKQLLLYGFSGDKDAGEQFFRGAQRYGFDFYSFHFFLQHTGIIKALALGDYTINMGQGLIHWQTTAFTKSSQSLAVKREASFLRPYHSAGEFNFHRGAAISLVRGNWQTGFFISSQKISTNINVDSVGREDLFSSFENGGYHRTAAEDADRNNSNQLSAGACVRYESSRFGIGFNFIRYHFSRSFQKRDLPYNLYSLKGNKLTNLSLDYSYTFRNLHLFGEYAADHQLHAAFVQGALISLGENLDLSFIYRNISPEFMSLYSDAFTENTVPVNERGLYTGLCFRPAKGLQLDLYYDVYEFPWLKYQVIAPSMGKDFSIQLLYQPVKNWTFTSLYRNEMKSYSLLRRRWRIGAEYIVSRSVRLASRMEFIWLGVSATTEQHGFLGMADLQLHKSGFSVNAGIMTFETDGYATRVYTYEADMLYNYSLPAYYGRGIHYYINLHRDFTGLVSGFAKHARLSGWLKWMQTYYSDQASIGSGLDIINGNHKSELKLQLLIQWF
jgi:Helix-hairpin-helix motif